MARETQKSKCFICQEPKDQKVYVEDLDILVCLECAEAILKATFIRLVNWTGSKVITGLLDKLERDQKVKKRVKAKLAEIKS